MRALAGDLLTQDFVTALYAKGMSRGDVLRHVARNAAATALSVMGLQLGYLLGGSILIETVFNWPGSGFLLSNAIFQRDLPLLQGTILVLARHHPESLGGGAGSPRGIVHDFAIIQHG